MTEPSRIPIGPDFRADAVSAVYARALLEMAHEQGKQDTLCDELTQVYDILGDNDDLRRLFASRVISAEERRGVIERVFRGRVSDLLYRFLQVLNQKGRLVYLRTIAPTYQQLLDEQRGIVAGTLTTATQLDRAEVDQIAAALGAAMDEKEVRLTQQVDPSLIGGVTVQVGSQLIDASVATRLRRIKQKLTEKGRERARSSDEWQVASGE